jgi:hypothetical protein
MNVRSWEQSHIYGINMKVEIDKIVSLRRVSFFFKTAPVKGFSVSAQ